MFTVLIAEDDEHNRELVRQTFEDSDRRILTAANGREALDILESEAVDLIISDVVMPVMDGKALLDALRASGAPSSQAPFVVLTAYSEHRRHFLERGVAAFIEKPFSGPELLDVAECAMQRANAAKRQGGSA